MANPLLRGLRPVYPGEILREDVLPALGKTKTEVARLLHISRQSLHEVLSGGQPITPKMALRIGKLTGTTAESWLRMQQAFDLSLAEREIADEIASIPTLRAA